MPEQTWALAGLGCVAVLALALAGAVAIRRRLVVVEVVGDSMSPTYHSGDRLMVRRTRRFRAGDVVVAQHQGGGRHAAGADPTMGTNWLVKRLVAVPGDPVPAAVTAVVGRAGGKVPAGMGVLLGDHPESTDSRRWGYVPLADLAGVVVTRLGGGPGGPG